MAEAEPSSQMCSPRASTETGEDCSTSSRLYIFLALGFADPNTVALPADVLATSAALAVGCLAGPSLSPPDSKVIRPLSGRCLRPPATASHFAPRRLSIFVGLDGEYLEPFCKAERRASSPSPSLPGSGYDSSAGCCLDPDASRGPLSQAARARAPACRPRTWPFELQRCTLHLQSCLQTSLQTSRQSPRCRLVAGPSKGHHHQQQHYSTQAKTALPALASTSFPRPPLPC